MFDNTKGGFLPPRDGRPPRYSLYIDESGDHQYRKLEHVQDRFIGLLGVWFENDDYLQFRRDLDQMKADLFGVDHEKPVNFHRYDIVHRKGVFVRLCSPDFEERFNQRLLQLLDESDFTVVSVVVDKKRISDQYIYPRHPYHLSFEILLERYCLTLNRRSAKGDVFAESREKKEDNLLSAEYTRFFQAGTGFMSAKAIQRVLTSKDLKLRKKESHIPGIELGDPLAHPVKHQILQERGIIEDKRSPFAQQLASVLEPKFNRDQESGEVNGFGKVLFPK